MRNFIIKNQSDSTTEIDIIGEIGQDWFTGEGNTIDSVLSDLRNVNTPNIQLNISSLGGDVNHALGIHDAIAMHPSKVTAKITGFTASSGTIVAMAADSVEMSDNALFLVHNAWTLAMGNQHDMREMADDLARVDDRIINIYSKKTGKDSETIHDLMKEEKWISADEAKEFGFINEVFEPVAMAASLNKVINSDKLPKVPERIINQIETMNIKEEFESFKASVMEIVNGKKEESENVNILDEEAVVNSIEEINAKVDEVVDSLQDANNTIEAKDAEIITLKAKVEELEATIAKDSADATEVEAVDPDVDAHGDVQEHALQSAVNSLRRKLPTKSNK